MICTHITVGGRRVRWYAYRFYLVLCCMIEGTAGIDRGLFCMHIASLPTTVFPYCNAGKSLRHSLELSFIQLKKQLK